MKLSFRSYLKLAGICIFLIVAACACNPVISKKAVGEMPVKLIAAEWDGSWITPDGAVHFKVIDPEKGILNASWIEQEQGRSTLKTATVELRTQGDWLFANMQEDNKGKSRGYLWARVKKESRQIIVWEPDRDQFAALIKQGIIAGKPDGSDLVMDGLEPNEVKAITDGKRGVPFKWDQPIIFTKAGD